MDLSLCMIVRDEEAQLSRCLESVKGVVDEIVIVDTGSTDRSVEIAQTQGARVYPFTWCDDFSAARNLSLQHAQGDWILVLDADEVLLPGIVPVLKQAIQSPDHLVINLLRQEVGSHQAPYSLISRLFRRRADIHFSHPYHELIDDSVTAILHREPDWKIVDLPGIAIAHTGYQRETIDQRQKADRARTLMERFLGSHPEDAYLCNKLGALYVEMGEVDKGLELLQRGLKAAQIPAPVLYELHYHLGDTYRQQQNYAQADTHFQQAVEQPISSRLKLGAYNNWGNLRMAEGNPQAARVLFQKCVEIDSAFTVGYFNLGMALKDLGDLRGAIVCYQKAIQLNPTYAEAYQNLGVALLKGGSVKESLEIFRQAIALHEQQGSPEAERLQQGLQSMGFSI